MRARTTDLIFRQLCFLAIVAGAGDAGLAASRLHSSPPRGDVNKMVFHSHVANEQEVGGGVAPATDGTTPSLRAVDLSRTAGTPADLYGPLFDAVQRARVFTDNKTFVDLVPRVAPAEIMRAFRAENPHSREELARFVAAYFRGRDADPAKATMREHIKALWSVLAKPPVAIVPGSSSLQLLNTFVVAGGRFGEMYYWDSYFTMLGLKADGETQLVDAMLGNFVSLIERYGHVPNGTRTYYLSRSQPPFLSLMMDLSVEDDPAILARRLKALKAEYAYWMAGGDCLGADARCQHVVRMPDGSLLNRYWDARETPREESYTQDIDTAAKATLRPPPEVYKDLRAAAESGWDFSSRWLKDGKRLSTINTTNIVPVDLNSLLWNLEKSIARRCAASGDRECANAFEKRASYRRAAMTRYLWSAADKRFGDWDLSLGKLTPSINAAMLYPLFVGLADSGQADQTTKLAAAQLLAPGGIRTTTVATGEQWDEPNGWAPLVWIAVEGFDRYGHRALADDLARRWVKAVSGLYACTGRLVEKYDIDSGTAGGGGEYPVQGGFGWTNGVTRALLDRNGVEEAVVETCPDRK